MAEDPIVAYVNRALNAREEQGLPRIVRNAAALRRIEDLLNAWP